MDNNNGETSKTIETIKSMDDTINNAVKKKTLGRRKIEMKKMEKKANLQVTFTKRRKGLFRKASELSVLCGADIAILVQSPADKIFAFGNPSVEALIGRFQGGVEIASSASSCWQIAEQVECRRKYEEALRRLEMEKMISVKRDVGSDELWWCKPCEGMDLQELEEFAEALELLRHDVRQKVESVMSSSA
ncbi:hypothetical protein OROHE_025528 [Orobanche hederae]